MGMDQVSLKAYAKVNLTLDIVGRRQDGYHLLQSVMQSVGLFDHIHLRKRARGIKLEVDDPVIPTDERNTAWQAAQLFFQRLPGVNGVEIEIEKNIPAEAGMGGGSADAAAVLLGLDALFGTGLDLAELKGMGVKIGADVPFCITGGTQFAEGIGDDLTQLPSVPPGIVVLVKPEVSVSTKMVYQMLETDVFGTQYSKNFIRHLTAGQDWPSLALELGNVLESVTIKLHPEIDLWKERLRQAGALGVLMSGSGSTVFGVFTEQTLAQTFQQRWQGQAQVFVTHPVGRGIGEANGGDL